MVTTRALAYVAGLISIIVWRSGRVAQNVIFSKHKFPAGYFAEGNFTTDCTTVKAPDNSNAFKYCEDATFWDLLDGSGKLEDRRVLLSCDAGRKSWNTVMGPLRDPEPHGALWLYEPGAGKAEFWKGKGDPTPENLHRLELKGYPAGHDFHPLGLEIYPSYAGNASNLYVVNHARARTVIEQFTVLPSEPSVATYVRTLTSPYFISPNSIALTSPDSFYVTNDHLLTRRLPYVGHVLPIIESVLALPFGFVSHITLDPSSTTGSPITSHKFSALFTPFPNGVVISPDGTRLAVASTTLNQVYIYARDPVTNDLTQLISTVPTPFTPDNLQYTHDGSALIVAGHPNFPALTAVAANKTDALAPSWVLSIALTKSDLPPPVDFDLAAPVSASGLVPAVAGHELKTLFQSDGTGFASSTTGLRDPLSSALYIAGLYAEGGMLVCQPA